MSGAIKYVARESNRFKAMTILSTFSEYFTHLRFRALREIGRWLFFRYFAHQLEHHNSRPRSSAASHQNIHILSTVQSRCRSGTITHYLQTQLATNQCASQVDNCLRFDTARWVSVQTKLSRFMLCFKCNALHSVQGEL
ncbi:Hypothetical_protein [Hexamita inflata]|uniref:Hypothetical_protein n=1 Tax=Hexamita inflata TaxID=28002 RepID=A0AA86RJG4_9EUKA|nr:Hypothetical protein HINF_LOCUS62348 [Hexamita inflata]